MMGPFIKLNTLLLFLFISIIQAEPVQATGSSDVPQEYTARYQVLHNGNRLADVTVRLSHEGNTWILHGYTHNTRGLADVLNVHGVQTTTGTWQEGRFYPEDYRFSFSMIGYKSSWHAGFDWVTGVVNSSGKKWDKQLPINGGATDPFSLSLSIRSLLAENQQHMTIDVIEEDKLDQQEYQAQSNEPLDTALGCMDTTRVKRIRKNAKRTSMFWYANDHNYVPVQVRHAKKNGNDFKLKIISLDVAGKDVLAVDHC